MSQLMTGAWKKSGRCDAGSCVEARLDGAGVAVRDNTLPGVELSFDRADWAGLIAELRADRLRR